MQKYKILSGSLEEDALRQALHHWTMGGKHTYKSGKEMARDHNGFTGCCGFTLDSGHDINATLTTSYVQLEVVDRSDGTRYTKTYKPDQFYEQAQKASKAHQIDMFEMMGI